MPRLLRTNPHRNLVGQGVTAIIYRYPFLPKEEGGLESTAFLEVPPDFNEVWFFAIRNNVVLHHDVKIDGYLPDVSRRDMNCNRIHVYLTWRNFPLIDGFVTLFTPQPEAVEAVVYTVCT